MKLLLTTIAAALLVGCGPSASERALYGAAADGNIEAVKEHLAAGTDVNAMEMAFSLAATYGHKEIVELLITNGTDVDARDNTFGKTALHWAAYEGRKETAELLIAKGADVNAKNADGETPLDLAIEWIRTETADLLRKHGGKTAEELEAAGN